MRSYWAEGHNQSYILLRVLVERRQVMAMLGDKVQRGTDDNEDEVEAFCRSFVNRGKKIWNTLMSPYRRDDEDVNEFIKDDNDIEDNEAEIQRPVFEKPESDLEDAFVKHLREKRLATKHGYDTSSNEEDDSSSEDESIGVDDDDDDDSDYDANVEEEEKEESEDEWVAKKLSKFQSPRKKSNIQQGRKNGRLKKSNATFDSDDHDSDDDDDDDDNDFVPLSAVKSKRNQFLSSDEE